MHFWRATSNGCSTELFAGMANEKIQRWRFDDLSVFGLLRVYTIKQIVTMLHKLMEAGLARQRDPEGVRFRPVMELTETGVAVMKGEQPAPALLADLVRPARPAAPDRAQTRSPQRVIADEADQALSQDAQRRFDRLRAVRLELSRQRQLPPYCICHDRTLKAIALAAPGDLPGLELIKGMGPNKVRMYGEALLGALRAD